MTYLTILFIHNEIDEVMYLSCMPFTNCIIYYTSVLFSHIDQAISQLRRSFNKLIQSVVPWQIIFTELIGKQFIFEISFNPENNPMRQVHILFMS